MKTCMVCFYAYADGARAEGWPRSKASLSGVCSSKDRVGALGWGCDHTVLEGLQFGPLETDASSQKGLLKRIDYP